ncbi:hypothetical protein IMZ48_44465 [Candidatus Bathyarchaeota archaeon]|nr:hypothetical protein [Candidatus Bathyarchaeota archaeon]
MSELRPGGVSGRDGDCVGLDSRPRLGWAVSLEPGHEPAVETGSAKEPGTWEKLYRGMLAGRLKRHGRWWLLAAEGVVLVVLPMPQRGNENRTRLGRAYGGSRAASALYPALGQAGGR